MLTASVTSVEVKWSSSGSITNFTISYTLVLRNCRQVRDSGSVVVPIEALNLTDGIYTYVVSGLEENSAVTCSISATNAEGTGPDVARTVNTMIAGMCVCVRVCLWSH